MLRRSLVLALSFLKVVVLVVQASKGAGVSGLGRYNVFKFGAVLSSAGETKEMQMARMGYELFFHEAGGLNITDRDGNTFHFDFEFLCEDDNDDMEQHTNATRRLLEDKGVHFLLGSHPKFAENETRISNEAGTMNIHCCVGPDKLYEQGFPYVFGVPASNTKYTELSLRSMALRGYKNFSILYREDNVFTKTTCQAAVETVEKKLKQFDDRLNVTLKTGYVNPEEGIIQFVEDMKGKKVDAVVACTLKHEGTRLVEALRRAKLTLKSLFITVDPTSMEWMDELKDEEEKASLPALQEAVEHIISAVQWHKGLTEGEQHKDSLFGNTTSYQQKFTDLFGKDEEPTYVAAGASAVGFTVYTALQRAFNNCDISETNGSVEKLLFNASAVQCGDGDEKSVRGYDVLRQAIKDLDLDSFFGRIHFNDHQRNDKIIPPTTQIKSKNGTYSIEAVLPIGTAKGLLLMEEAADFRTVCKEDEFLCSENCDPCDHYNNEAGLSEKDNAKCEGGTSVVIVREAPACFKCPANMTNSGAEMRNISDCVCKENFYQSKTNTEGKNESVKTCLECPEGACCLGGGHMPSPKRNFWMDSSRLDIAYECEGNGICLGGDLCNETSKGDPGKDTRKKDPSKGDPDKDTCKKNPSKGDPDKDTCKKNPSGNKCKQGYKGRLCARCSKDYYAFINQCKECPDHALVVILMVAIYLGWYFLNVEISRSVASLEMMLNWAQLANVIGDVVLRWPDMLGQMFGVANILDFDVDILEPGCLWTSWSFAHNFYVQLLLPFVMSLMGFSGYMASFLAQKFMLKADYSSRRAENSRVLWFKKYFSWLVDFPENEVGLKEKWDRTIATFLASVEVTYVTITKYCFDVFRSRDIAGVRVLVSDPSEKWGTPLHTSLRVFAVLGTLFYSAGYLAFVVFKMFDLKKQGAFHKPENLRRYGFLYRRFECQYFWTPIVILLRRLLFVMILVLVNNPSFQAGGLAIIIIGSLMLHVYTAPFLDSYLDVMFSFLLIALMFEAFSGVMFYSENLPGPNRKILESIVMLVVVLLLFVFLVILMTELVNKYFKHRIKELILEGTRSPNGMNANQADAFGRLLSTRYLEALNEVDTELLETFKHPYFIYKALTRKPELVGKWNELSRKLKKDISSQSATSYLSKVDMAKFWRKLVDQFPELIDFLAVADEDVRTKLKISIETMYNDFYLTNKLEKLPLFGTLNWRDRAPMACWLAHASTQDRESFTTFMIELFRAAGDTRKADLLAMKMMTFGCAYGLNTRTYARKNLGRVRTPLRLANRLSFIAYENMDCRSDSSHSTTTSQNTRHEGSSGSSGENVKCDLERGEEADGAEVDKQPKIAHCGDKEIQEESIV